MQVKRDTGRRTGTTEAVRDLLSDGKWHHQRELIEVIRKLVPPQDAYRTGRRSFKKPDEHPHFRVIESGYANLASEAASRVHCATHGPIGNREYRAINPIGGADKEPELGGSSPPTLLRINSGLGRLQRAEAVCAALDLLLEALDEWRGMKEE